MRLRGVDGVSRNSAESWSTGRLAAAALMGTAGLACMHTALVVSGGAPGFPAVNSYLAAFAIGALAGWIHLGPIIKERIWYGALAGLGTGVMATLYLCLLATAGDMVSQMGVGGFRSVERFFTFMAERWIDHAAFTLEVPIWSFIALSCTTTGVLAALARRAWG